MKRQTTKAFVPYESHKLIYEIQLKRWTQNIVKNNRPINSF